MKSRIGTAVTLPVFFSGSVRRSPRPSRAMIVCTSLLLVASVLFVGAGTNPGPASPATAKAKTEAAISSLPISFIENAGQTDPRIDFMLQGKGAVPSFTSHGVIWRLTDGKKAWVAKQSFVGAASEPIGIDPQETRFSWFKGDPDEWVTGARSYSGIRYEDLWPGIDLVYAGKDGALEYRFVVHPGADPGDIRVAYRGAEPSLLPSGDLRVRTPVRSLTERAPFTYQGREDEKAPVPSSFRLEGDTVAFRVGEYDRGRTLVVDPAILDYAGFIGGSGAEEGLGVAVDGTGAAYVTGITSSTEATFPETTGPDLTQNGASDAFVAKVSADGTGLSYAGFIGGSGSDAGRGVAVDGTGAAYVAGSTSSTEATFPETTGPDLTQNGGTDAFVAKVSADGTGLSYAGFIGGSGDDFGNGVAVDGTGAAYVAGMTSSTEATFPETTGPDLTQNGGFDAFVAKVSADGTGLSYAGFIGGSGFDEGRGVAVDGTGAAYVTGRADFPSTEATFPETTGPDLTQNGGTDAFVAKVSADGTGLSYAGFIGGSGGDEGRGVAVDGTGAAYVAGYTSSTEATFPETTGPDLTQNGGFDAFVAKVSADGTGLSYAGFIGGSGGDFGQGVAVDGTGAAYVAGQTLSTEATFPETTGPDLTQNGGTDAFVAKVSDGCTIVGTAAGEKIVGTAGPDVICGLGGGDLIKGLGDDDILLGQDGKDRLIGGAGDDTADGGSGVDTADHRTKGTVGGVTVDLAAGTSVGGASFGSDTLVSIERVIGSLKNDTITGDADANTLDGAKGADMLTGGDGPDILMGGYSADTLDGTDGVGGNDTLRGGAKPNSAIDTCTSDAGDTEVSCEA